MSKSTICKIYGAAIITTLALLSIFIFLNHHYDGTIWQTMKPSKSALTAEYCEQDNTTHFFRQTMNTYSNLAYFFLGMVAVLISLYDRKDNDNLYKNHLQEFPAASFFFGCCMVYLSLGSAFFHASLTWVGQRADMNGTYSICITLIGISFYRLSIKEKPTSLFQLIFVGSLLAVVILFIKIHLLISSSLLLPLLIVLIITATVLNYIRNNRRFNVQFALLSLMLMFVAFAFRTIDVHKIACDPTSFYQGHALWHFFTGMSAFLLYWFYRSEKT